eukprot:5353244-Alexandrium_andersonii.AAC.1
MVLAHLRGQKEPRVGLAFDVAQAHRNIPACEGGPGPPGTPSGQTGRFHLGEKGWHLRRGVGHLL